MEKKEAIAKVPLPDFLICSECGSPTILCAGCNQIFCPNDPIYCFKGRHYCEECGETCDCKMD